MVEPSCPALVILDDDAFRRSLIKTLDQEHFTVTFVDEGEAVDLLKKDDRPFSVVLLGLDVNRSRGIEALEYLRDHRPSARCGLIIIGDPNIRAYARWADETLLQPVDPGYVARRARTYCGCDVSRA